MKNLILWLLILGLTGVCTYAQEDKFKTNSEPIAGRYIVVLNETEAGAVGENSRSADLSNELTLQYGGKVDRVFRYALNGYSVKMSAEQAVKLSRDTRVKFVEEDGIAYGTQSSVPWGLDRIDQRNLPLNGLFNTVGTGAGVNAYVIDTGILASHDEFGGRASVAYDAVGDGQNGNDCNGHGTHVAGILGGANYGVAKQVTLRAVRVLGCNNTGSISDIIEGVDWVTNNRIIPAVANMSLGSNYSQSLDNAVRGSILNSGVTYVIAAGNDNANACDYSPGRVDLAITVGSTDINDARSSFSNYGGCVDIFAPGSDITSAWIKGNSSTTTLSGTSMASPHVAGVAAIYLSSYLSWNEVAARIIADSTTDVITNVGGGSPNRLVRAPQGTTGASYYGTVSSTGVFYYHPLGGFAAGGGRFVADATSGAYGTNLALEKSTGSGWNIVAVFYNNSYPPTHNPHLEYIGTPGTYRWSVFSYQGTGNYVFSTSYPVP